MSASDLGLDELKARALHDDFDSAKYGVIAEEEINAAYRMIVRTTSIGAAVITANLPPTVAGTATVAAPADKILVIDVRRTGNFGGSLTPIERDELLELPPSSGDPYAFTLDGTNIRLYPTPRRVETLVIDYRQAPAWLATTDKPTLLPNDYRPMLAYYARAALFDYEGDLNEAQRWTARADRVLAQLRGDLQRPVRANRRIPGTWAGTPAAPRFRLPG